MDPAEILEQSMFSRQKIINDAILNYDSEIQQFYEDSTIFITGGSGFIGKQLVEKLFRSCKIKKIYLLLRTKKGRNSKQRVLDIVKDPLFDKLKTIQPKFVDNIIGIDGNITSPNLGVSDDDWKLITDDVSIIFHVAATVRFDEPIKKAVQTNVYGTKEALKLARECKKLRSLVYVSTAYSHAVKTRIGKEVLEQFYPSPVDPEDLLRATEEMDDKAAFRSTETLTRGWPNTYCFTKAVAEELVRRADGLPVCVVRPSVVISTYKEPVTGWTDHINGATGLTLGCLMGIIHVMHSDQNIKIDLVPVDYVNNAIICAGWKTAVDWERGLTEKIIYTVAIGRSDFHWRDGTYALNHEIKNYISPKAVSLVFAIQTRNYYLYLLLNALLHYIPGCIIDVFAILSGNKPWAVKMYRKIQTMSTSLSYFTTNDWIFKDTNLLQLKESLSHTDRIIYNFDISDIDMKEMLLLWQIGLRRYIVKDELKNTEWGVKKQIYFRIATVGFILLFIFVLCYIIL